MVTTSISGDFTMVRRVMFALGVLLGFTTIFGQIPARAADEPFPRDMLTVLGEAAVYCVETRGTLVVNLPSTVEVNFAALQAAYDDPQIRNQLPAESSKAQCYCQLIAADPARFLRLSEERASLSFSGAGGSGTAVAVSREGILLTNAHVVTIGLESLIAAPKLVAQTLSDPSAAIARQLDERISEEVHFQTDLAILLGLVDRQLIKSEARDVKIRLFNRVPELPKLELRLGGLAPLQELEQGIPAQVLAKGEGYPGRDVAVLRTSRTPAGLSASDPYLLDRDRLVCLRVADSDDVLEGTSLKSFGFPGAVFDKAVMKDESERLVNCQPGELSQIKKLRGAMPTVFEITAEINHGYSGGPVIDMQGNVIGLNVAVHPLKVDQALHVPGHTLAVPINVAKPFLKAAGIEKLDPGPLAEHWERGLRLYAAKDFAAAEKEFTDLLELETGAGFSKNLPGIASTPEIGGLKPNGNANVERMRILCLKQQGKLFPKRD
jgi:serine protease Do